MFAVTTGSKAFFLDLELSQLGSMSFFLTNLLHQQKDVLGIGLSGKTVKNFLNIHSTL